MCERQRENDRLVCVGEQSGGGGRVWGARAAAAWRRGTCGNVDDGGAGRYEGGGWTCDGVVGVGD